MIFVIDKKCKACYTKNVKHAVHKKLGGDFTENRIAELRKGRKITQEELASAVMVTRQTIISLESGRYNASLVLAHKIACFFGLKIEEVFIFDEEESYVDQ